MIRFFLFNKINFLVLIINFLNNKLIKLTIFKSNNLGTGGDGTLNEIVNGLKLR